MSPSHPVNVRPACGKSSWRNETVQFDSAEACSEEAVPIIHPSKVPAEASSAPGQGVVTLCRLCLSHRGAAICLIMYFSYSEGGCISFDRLKTCISFFMKCLFIYLANFAIVLLVFFFLICKCVLFP